MWPVEAFSWYLVCRGTYCGPWLVLSTGEFVTRKLVCAFLKIIVTDSLDLNTHSFKISGASAAASCGIPDSAIKIIGRWSSDCYRQLKHLSDRVLMQWCSNIANLNDVPKLWDLPFR